MARRLIDQDPRREARRQGILLDRLEVSFRNRLRDEIFRATMEIARIYEITGEVPGARDHIAELESIYRAMVIASATTFGARVAGQAKAVGIDLERKGFAETMMRMALEYIGLEAVRRRIVAVAETTRNLIVRRVDRGYSAGEGVDKIARGIREDAQSIALSRAALIARTETHGAANYGAWRAAKESGLPMQKEWVSVEDHRTRRISEGDAFDHVTMNGVIAAMDTPFQVPMRGGGFAPAMYPGDPSAPAGCSINCRCALSFKVSLDDLIDG